MMAFDRMTELLPKRLLEIASEFESDVKLTNMNISEKALLTPTIKTKWTQIFLEEKRYLEKLKNDKSVLEDEYVRSHGKSNIPKIITEKESMKNEKIILADEKIRDQKLVVEFLELATGKITSSIGFDIKNSIEITKLEGI